MHSVIHSVSLYNLGACMVKMLNFKFAIQWEIGQMFYHRIAVIFDQICDKKLLL